MVPINRPLFLSLVALVVLTAAPVWAQGDATVVIEAAGPAITPVQNRGPLARQPRPLRPWRPQERRPAVQEPATARGYADGYERGLDDGRDRDRYDPVGHRNYRSGDLGYYRDYGPREAYRNNYRSGFRQGYEDGYRDGARGRR